MSVVSGERKLVESGERGCYIHLLFVVECARVVDGVRINVRGVAKGCDGEDGGVVKDSVMPCEWARAWCFLMHRYRRSRSSYLPTGWAWSCHAPVTQIESDNMEVVLIERCRSIWVLGLISGSMHANEMLAQSLSNHI